MLETTSKNNGYNWGNFSIVNEVNGVKLNQGSIAGGSSGAHLAGMQIMSDTRWENHPEVVTDELDEHSWSVDLLLSIIQAEL